MNVYVYKSETEQSNFARFRSVNSVVFDYSILNEDGKRTTYVQAYTDHEKVIFKDDDIIEGVYVKMIEDAAI